MTLKERMRKFLGLSPPEDEQKTTDDNNKSKLEVGDIVKVLIKENPEDTFYDVGSEGLVVGFGLGTLPKVYFGKDYKDIKNGPHQIVFQNYWEHDLTQTFTGGSALEVIEAAKDRPTGYQLSERERGIAETWAAIFDTEPKKKHKRR